MSCRFPHTAMNGAAHAFTCRPGELYQLVPDGLFHLHGNSYRLLDLLKNGPLTTGQVCNYFRKLDRCSVMQHLGVLERADLIIVKREGRKRWNYFNPLPIRELHHRWISRYAESAVDLLAKTKQDMET